MKKIICFLTLFLLLSCEIQYEGKRRFVAETTITDRDGNPLEGITIEVEDGDDNISYNNTDKNGYSIQMFPSRDRGGSFSININPDGNVYQSKAISNIKESDFADFRFNLGTVTLFKNSDLTNFYIELERVNENTRLESLEINAITSESHIDYHEPEEEYFYPETYFDVLKNQNFTLFYSVRNFDTSPSTLIEYSVNISIGNVPLIYELEY